MDQRAKEKLGTIGWACCRYVGYIINDDYEDNRGGAKGWLSFGTATDKPSEAKVIVVNGGSHVGYVTDGGKTVYDSPGENSGKPIRRTDFNTWKGWFNSYQLRK